MFEKVISYKLLCENSFNFKFWRNHEEQVTLSLDLAKAIFFLIGQFYSD